MQKRGWGQPMLNPSIPLLTKKTPALIGNLDYRLVPLSKRQKRFAGRYAVSPDIDLHRYTTRAVIDWITLGVLLSRPTHFWRIQDEIKTLLGRVPHIINNREDSRTADARFDITIQEPEIPIVLNAMALIRTKFGLEMDPVVRSIEISIDFTPRIPSNIDRAKIVRTLANHLIVRPDVISDINDRPRTTWGIGSKSTMRLIYHSSRLPDEQNTEFLISTDRDHAPFSDGTLSIGNKGADLRWRIMDKTRDQQNRAAGTFLALDERSKRARIEVTLDRPEVASLGVDYLDDLKGLNFNELQGRYFRFVLPTFSMQTSQPGVRSAIKTWEDRQRMTKFMKTGVIGLKAMDDALAERQKKLRRDVQADLHERGLSLPKVPRIATGASGSFVAYADLNERVLTSLRNLGKRVAADFATA
ncbi:hypothetical protein [Brucella anthropi]|uniref:hypothetical protein n=1 Tax=Brucella anthropi TaxID=529 RepID=UPI003D97925D